MIPTASNETPTSWRGYLEQGRYSAASKAHQTATMLMGDTAEPGLGTALALLAACERHVRRKAYSAALAAFDDAAANAPDLLPWASLRLDLQAIEQAGRQLEGADYPQTLATLDAITSEHWLAERHTLQGTFAAIRGEPAGAREHFEEALRHDPDHVRALTNRGNLHLNDGNLEAAMADYRRAIEIDEGFGNAHHNLGVALRRQGKIAASVASLRKAQKLALQQDGERLRGRGGAAAAAAGKHTPWWRRRVWWWLLVGLLIYWAFQQGLF